MKRLFTVFLLILSVFTFGKMVEASSTTVDIQVLQGTGLSAGSSFSAEVGSTVSIDTSSFRPNGSTFQFWIVDGSLRHYPEDHTFRIQSSMKLIAVYAASDEHVVIFIDSNGKIIEAGGHLAQYLTDENLSVVAPKDAPTKPQSTFKGWSLLGSTAEPIQGDIPNATGHAVYLATYEAATGETAQANISVEGGISDKTDDVAGMNEVVEIMPDDSLGTFSYWVDENNQILSKKYFYSFTALGKNRSFRAVYDDQEAISTPIINLVAYPDLRGGEYVSYVGQYELVEGYDLVEFGIVYEKDGSDVYVKATNYNEETNEFLMSFTEAGKSNFRAYLKYVDANGYVFTEFNSGIITQYATDLIISEYIEGSSNNKYLEIYNGTGQTVDLSDYSLELYTNGSSTANTNVKLSDLTATLNHGEVIIVRNSQAAIHPEALTTYTNGVANFNGDDAIVLEKNGEVIDSFGQVGVDPGSAWTGDGVSTVDKTLVRKPTVLSGRTDSTSTFDPSLEWVQYKMDTVEYLGSHTMIFGETSPKYDSYKVNQVLLGLPVFEESYSIETTVTLPKYNENGAAITWEFQNAADPNNSYMNLETGVITIPETGSYMVKIKATIQVGTTVVEKLYEFDVLGKLTIEEVRQQANGTDVEFLGVVSGFIDKIVFVEDSTNAIQLNFTEAPTVQIGDKLSITGTVDIFRGLTSVNNPTVIIIQSGVALKPIEEIVSISDVNTDLQGKRISMENLEVVSFNASSRVVTLSKEGNTIAMRSTLTSGDLFDLISNLPVGRKVNLTGVHVGWYNDAQLMPISVSQIELIPLTDEELAQEDLDAITGIPEQTDVNLTLPTVGSVNGLTITWQSSNTTYMSHTGVINRHATENQTVTLTATVTKGTATLTKEFTVTVIKEGAAEPVTYTENFEDQSVLTGTYANGSFTNNAGIEFTYAQSRNEGDYAITGKGIMFQKSGSSLKFTVSDGLKDLKFQYRKAFTGKDTRRFKVYINGVEVHDSETWGGGSGAQTQIYNFKLATQYNGSIEVKIECIGAQMTLDNISWSSNP